jgi:bifunctional DNA-binding transcriptional regulator/antitoxin component of YhaV-PrlF toxin-antitoxin module
VSTSRRPATPEGVTGGFGTIDDKGRISLARPVREALGVEPGSPVAYVVLEGAVLIIPQDEELIRLMQQGQRALEAVGLTAQDLVDALPEARAELFVEHYGAAFLQEVEQAVRTYHLEHPDE